MRLFQNTFAGVLWDKIRTRASFSKILFNYISEESLLTAVCDKNVMKMSLTYKTGFLGFLTMFFKTKLILSSFPNKKFAYSLKP